MTLKLFIYSLLPLLISLAGCTPISPKSQAIVSDNVNSTLWVQTSAEYKANSMQAYNAANAVLKRALAESQWTAILEQGLDFSSLPPAIILDIDETVLDNSQYQAELILSGKPYDSATWDKWVALKAAPAVPGAVEFLNAAQSRGIKIIYISNRACASRNDGGDPCPQKQDTLENLHKVGLTQVDAESILLKNQQPEWTSEKKSRRETIAENYRVIMLFGDDLGDFLPDVKKDISVKVRDGLVSQYQNYWGIKWFALANPTYGSWMSVLDEPKASHLKGF